MHISFLFYMWTCLVKKIIEHCEHALWWLNMPAIILCMNTPSETLRVLWTCLVMPCDRLWSMPNMHASLISLYEHTQWNILSVWTDPVKQCQHKKCELIQRCLMYASPLSLCEPTRWNIKVNIKMWTHHVMPYSVCMLHCYHCVNQPSVTLKCAYEHASCDALSIPLCPRSIKNLEFYHLMWQYPESPWMRIFQLHIIVYGLGAWILMWN